MTKTAFRLPIANIDGWLVNAVADPLRDAGGHPVPRVELERMADLRVGPTATTDGYIVADANGLSHEEGQGAIISEALRILRVKRWISSDDEAPTWTGPSDGDLSLDVGGRIVIVRAQRSRKQSTYRNELDLLSRGQSDPYKVIVVGDRGSETERKLAVHPLADLIPVMADSDLERFLDDVKANGVNDPIILFESKVLDGKHRLWAAKRLGKPLRTREFKGDEAAARTYVFSANIYRRHLTGAQIVALAAKSGIIADAKAEAKDAQNEGGKVGGEAYRPSEVRFRSIEPNLTGNGVAPTPKQMTPAPKSGDGSWEQRAAKKVGGLVSPATLRRFDDGRVADAPETLAKVESGEITSVAGAVKAAAEELGTDVPGPIPKSTLSRLSAATYAIRRAGEELDNHLGGASIEEVLSQLDIHYQEVDALRDALQERSSHGR